MKRTIVRTCKIEETARVMQMRGIFDVQPSAESREEWEVDLPAVGAKGEPVDPPSGAWRIGLIVGPSGSGKSTAAREFFGDKVIQGFEWHPGRSVLDGFPRELGVKEVTGLMSSVGFSSPPAWLRPFHVLSTGQQFRVTVARALAEMPEMAVIDEWTSVVDRTVAQIGSAAVAKAVRRSGRRLVAVTCHYDVADWLQPDWILDMADGSFQWRSVQPRPTIEIQIVRCHYSAWNLFKKHHYLTADMLVSAHCYVALHRGQPVAFNAVAANPNPHHSGWRSHRLVTLPDWQGCGVGMALANAVAAAYASTGRPYHAITASPSLVHARARHPHWNLERKPSNVVDVRGADKAYQSRGFGDKLTQARSPIRSTATFRWVGPTDAGSARAWGIL